jgi:hypothetical protein
MTENGKKNLSDMAENSPDMIESGKYMLRRYALVLTQCGKDVLWQEAF